MKFLFIIDTKQTYRIFSPIINSGINLDHEITICHIINSRALNNPKIDISPFANLNKANINIIELFSFDELKNFISSSDNFDFYISLKPVQFYLDSSLKNKISGKWIIFQVGLDSYLQVWYWEPNVPLLQNYERLIFSYSEHLGSYFNKFKDVEKLEESNLNYHNYSNFFKDNSKILNIGFPDIDEKIKKIDQAIIRKKYNIPENKEIFLYLPFPFKLSHPFQKGYNSKYWHSAFSGIYQKLIDDRKLNNQFSISFLRGLLKKLMMYLFIFINREAFSWYLSGYSEKKVMLAIKEFCKKNNLYFVLKNRSKYPGIKDADKIADLVVNDEEEKYYPTVFQELLSIAKITSGYNSTSVFECISMNSYYIDIVSPNIFFRGERLYRKFFGVNVNSLYNFDGVVKSMSIEDIIDKFIEMPFKDFLLDPSKKLEYEKLFINSSKNTPSDNFYRITQNI